MLINWNINKSESSNKKKERIKFSGKSVEGRKKFESELNDALTVSRALNNFDSDFYLENLTAVENNLISH